MWELATIVTFGLILGICYGGQLPRCTNNTFREENLRESQRCFHDRPPSWFSPFLNASPLPPQIMRVLEVVKMIGVAASNSAAVPSCKDCIFMASLDWLHSFSFCRAALVGYVEYPIVGLASGLAPVSDLSSNSTSPVPMDLCVVPGSQTYTGELVSA